MLQKEEFFNYVKANVGGYLAPKFRDSKVSLESVIKANDRKLTALVISAPKDKSTAVPCIYLDDFYDRYSNGAHLFDLLDEIAGLRNLRDDYLDDIDLGILNRYSVVRERLVIKMCDPALNKEMLQNKVHTIEGEFAALYYIDLAPGDDTQGMVAIDYSMLQKWDVSTVQLRKDAILSELQRGYVLYTMENLLCSMSGMEDKVNLLEQAGTDHTKPIIPEMLMYVLTNNSMMFGASAIMQSQIMDQACSVIGTDKLVVLPSSIHEVLLLPISEYPDITMLSGIVKEVNSTQVDPADLLSDKVQIYDSLTHRLFDASDLDSTGNIPA